MLGLSAFLIFALAAEPGYAQLPTVTMEHAIYLRSRANGIRRLADDKLVDYLLATKLGSRSFEDLHAQVAAMNLELTKMVKLESLSFDDGRVKKAQRTLQVLTEQLHEEARRIRGGLLIEGQIAEEIIITLTPPQR